jgi:hypothetical protein
LIPWIPAPISAREGLVFVEFQIAIKNSYVPTAKKKVLKDVGKSSCEAMGEILEKHTLQDLYDRRDTERQSALMYI